MLLAGVGAVPPQFLQSYNRSARGVLKPDMYGGQIKTDQWDGPEGFQYWTSAEFAAAMSEADITGNAPDFEDTSIHW